MLLGSRLAAEQKPAFPDLSTEALLQACNMAGEMRGEILYREVLLQIEQNSSQEVEIDTGSLPNVAIKSDGHIRSGAGGGFSYKDTARVESFGKNRFIHW